MRVLFYDIESMPHTSYTWGTYKQFIAPSQIVQSGRVACWAVKEYGKDRIQFASELNGHKEMITKLHKILSDADAVCGYNSINFDNKMMNAEYAKYGLAPLPPAKQLDLFRVVKKHFKLPSYKLEYVVKYFGIGEKVKHAGFDLWVRCMAGERQAWKEMREYNERDTELLEALYIKLLPWIGNHPSHSLDTEAMICTNCGSNHLHRKGYQTSKVGKWNRYQCQDCGHWMRSRTNEVPRGTELLVSL